MKEKISTIITWIVIICTIAVCVCLTNRCAKQKEQKNNEAKLAQKEEETAAIIRDPYIYLDKNDVYHIKNDCFVLTMGVLKVEDNKDASYSTRYVRKDSISDWEQFVATHQMCCECFSKDILFELKSNIHAKNLDSVYIYNESQELVEKTYTRYDQWGHLIDEEKYEIKEGKWVGKIREVNEYNELGQKIMAATYFWENNKWQGTDWLGCKNTMEYDFAGNEICRYLYKWKDNQWELTGKIEKKYDAQNNQVSESWYKGSHEDWHLTSSKEYYNFYN